MSEINTWPGWENVELLGEGSFGKVYKIRREEYGVVGEAALKVIAIPGSQADLAAAREEGMDEASATDYFKSFVEDLAAEFALMSSLKGNSNIVSYEDHMVVPREGEVGWDILIRMELLTPLQAAVAQKPLTERDVAILGMDICRALTLCRKRGILHRDIKPENIFVSRDGNYKLGDFGVARVAEKTISAMSRKGTYNYMAPEVYKGEKYGFGADIYSLGIVLYRYLNNNRLPFLPPFPEPIQYSDRENALVRRIGGEELPPPVNGSGALKRAVLKACAYRAENRYDSAESFLADLEAAMHAPAQNGISPAQEETQVQVAGTDASGGRMSAAAAGQSEFVQADDSSLRQEDNSPAVIDVAEVLTAENSGKSVPESGKEPDEISGATSGKKSDRKSVKRKRTLVVALLGATALVAVVIVIKAALGGGNPGAHGLMTEETARAQAMEEALALLETPTDAAWLDSRRAAIKAFDTRLVGCWEPVGTTVEQNGNQYISGVNYRINILETGEFYQKGASEWMRIMGKRASLPSMTIKDGKTDFLEAAQSVYDDIQLSSDNIYTLLPSISDLSVTYELTDYKEEGELNKEFYNSREEDGLTIRIQGNYQDGPLTVKTIDTSLYFKLCTYLDDWFYPDLEGRWTDNNGNIWAFRISREPAENFNKSEFSVVFAMKDSTGQIHEGKSLRVAYHSETVRARFSIRFQDGITVPEYTIVSYDGMTLELEGEDGSSLVLTRN